MRWDETEWERAAKWATAGSDVRIRPLQRGDLDEVLRIIRLHDTDDAEAAAEGFYDSEFDGYVERWGHVVIEGGERDRVLGVSGWYIDDLEADGVYWLGWTYVNPYSQGQGYGSMLMEFVIAMLERFGARKLFLSTSSLQKYRKAISFYERHGFEREGCLKDFYADGEDQLIFGRRITAS